MIKNKKALNIVLLMAGESDSFHEAGYSFPKNLIETEGRPLVEKVINNLKSIRSSFDCSLIFLVSKEECSKFHTNSVIKLLVPDAKIIEVPGKTAGAACTSLLAIDSINNDTPLLVLNGDELIDISLDHVLEDFERHNWDAGVMVFKSVHPRWSYVKLNEQHLVIEASEQNPISHFATCGFYFYKSGKLFVESIFSMIKKSDHLNGRYYVCPILNQLVLNQKEIGIFQIDRSQYHPIKNPKALEEYIDTLNNSSLKKIRYL